MDIIYIFKIILVLDLAWFIHILFIKKKWLYFLAIPICKKIFWSNKTFRWVIIMSLFSWIIWYYFFWFVFSFLLWLVWILWELPNSYIKRRLWIKSGEYVKWLNSLIQYIFDTLDSIIALIIFLNYVNGFYFWLNIIIIILWFINHSLIDIVCYKVWIKKINYPNPLIIFFQLLVWLIFRPIHFFYGNKEKIKLPSSFKYSKNIFISNHISKLDPFMICTSLDFSTLKNIIPFRYMISNSYTKKPIINFILILVWGYPAYIYDNNWRNQTLDYSKNFLDNWETVFIFPEGGIVKKSFWIGAFYLNRNIEKSIIHLFRIDKNNKRYKIEYKWHDDVRNYNFYMDNLNLAWKIIFNKIYK